MLIAMEGGIIPANLHYKTPHPDVPGLYNGGMKVVQENTDWKGGIVGVSSFGFGGSNVHVILKSNSQVNGMYSIIHENKVTISNG